MVNILNIHICICVYMCMGVIFSKPQWATKTMSKLMSAAQQVTSWTSFCEQPRSRCKPLWPTQTWRKLL